MSKYLKYMKHVIILSITLVLAFLGINQLLYATSLIDTPLPSFDVISPFVDSNKYTHIKTDDVAMNQQLINPTATILNTDGGTVYLDDESLAFQVVNSNGYLWSSTIDYDQPDFSNSFKQRARSAIIVESYNVSSSNYAITEENLFTEGTTVDTTLHDNGFVSLIRFGKSDILVQLEVTFLENQIIVEIPQAAIDESGDFKISSIKVYPYFGAVHEADVPGYVFLPDGIGALIDYKTENPLVNTNYQKEIYNRNIGYNIESDLSTFTSGGTHIYAPVFGFVHGVDQNAVFANITSGSEYGLINVYYPARTRGFTTVFSEFVFRKTYKQPIDKVGNTIALLQSYPNEIDIKIEYSLLENEEANYVGMAKTYRSYLESEILPDLIATEQANVPLKLETIGIEKMDGVLFTKSIVMTKLSDFSSMISELEQEGIDNITANITGFTSKGVTWSAPNYESLSSKIGNKGDLADINNEVSDLYLTAEYLMASNRSNGYNQYFDLAKKISDQLYMYNSATDLKYLLEFNKVRSIFNSSVDHLSDYEISGLSILSMGSLLYSDFGNQLYLKDQIKMMNELLSSYDQKVALYDVNAYLWGQIDAFYDFPMYSSQYVTFDDTVPFMSIALSGHMDLFGSNANFYPYARDELLRLIDFGVYPSFIVTQESSKLLQKTGLESIYSSRFDDLKPSIIAYYNFVNDALKYVQNAQIIDRVVISSGVIEVIYDNGFEIVVNYSSDVVIYQSQSISPKSYLVIDSNPLD
ncbi:MAG: hypothetical protein KKH01_05095 [Firmicutes bacterium]|nr:hypothetical protein [Bacillota bacterium]